MKSLPHTTKSIWFFSRCTNLPFWDSSLLWEWIIHNASDIHLHSIHLCRKACIPSFPFSISLGDKAYLLYSQETAKSTIKLCSKEQNNFIKTSLYDRTRLQKPMKLRLFLILFLVIFIFPFIQDPIPCRLSKKKKRKRETVPTPQGRRLVLDDNSEWIKYTKLYRHLVSSHIRLSLFDSRQCMF